MSNDEVGGDRSDARIEVGGDLSGQVAVGKDISQRQVVVEGEPPTPEELAALDAQFRELKQTVSEAAPPEEQQTAAAKIEELESAVTGREPDLTTMEYVRNWFAKHLPSVAGAVTGIIVNPIVGKLVAAAGDTLAAEFKRRFGGAAPS